MPRFTGQTCPCAHAKARGRLSSFSRHEGQTRASPLSATEAGLHDHLAAQDPPGRDDLEARLLEVLLEALLGEVGHVLVRVAARHDALVAPLDEGPDPGPVVGRPDAEYAARPEDALHLLEGDLAQRDVLDDLGADHLVEVAVLEG